jgi:hypothetical protein
MREEQTYRWDRFVYFEALKSWSGWSSSFVTTVQTVERSEAEKGGPGEFVQPDQHLES